MPILWSKAYAARSGRINMRRRDGCGGGESEDEIVEIALEMFPSQAVVDAERSATVIAL